MSKRGEEIRFREDRTYLEVLTLVSNFWTQPSGEGDPRGWFDNLVRPTLRNEGITTLWFGH